jgi:hypothetical protein
VVYGVVVGPDMLTLHRSGLDASRLTLFRSAAVLPLLWRLQEMAFESEYERPGNAVIVGVLKNF